MKFKSLEFVNLIILTFHYKERTNLLLEMLKYQRLTASLCVDNTNVKMARVLAQGSTT